MNVLMAVFDGLVDWLANGLVETTWWQVVLFTLVTTHIPNIEGGVNNGSVLFVFGRFALN